MATDDFQRLIVGQESAPAAWVVPGNGQIRPKAIFAHYDGSSATSAFVPAIKVISDGGETVGIYPYHTSVAAGGSADVSWFPHVADCDCATTTTDYGTVVSSLGPWAYYTLADVSSSQYQDTSGHGRTCTYDAQYVTQGGSAVLPNVNLPSATVNGPGIASNNHAITSVSNHTYTASVFTLTAWFTTSYAGTNDQIIAGLGRLDVSTTSLFAVWLVGHVPRIRLFDNTETLHTLDGTGTLNDGKPHMVAASYDGTTLRLYVDGIQANSTVLSVAMQTNQSIAIEMGAQLGGVVPRTFNGNLAQIGYFDQVLTPSNIAALYNSGASSVAAVESVLAGDSSITTGGTSSNVTVETASLDVIAGAHPTAADWSNNSHKITSVTDPTAAQDAATKNYVDTHGGSGTISSIGSSGGSIAITNPAGPATNVDVATSGVTAGTYGDSTHTAAVTVAADGRVTSASSVGISSAVGGCVQLFDELLSSPAASIDTTGHSLSGFTTLLLYMRVGSAVAAGNDTLYVTLNNDTTATYSYGFFNFALNSGSTNHAANAAVAVPSSCQLVPISGSTAQVPLCSVKAVITDYASAQTQTVQAESAYWFSAANHQMAVGNMTWAGAAAVTRIAIAARAGNLATGSRLTIYGLV